MRNCFVVKESSVCSLQFDSLNLTSSSDVTLYTFEIVVTRARGDTDTQGLYTENVTENSRKKLD